MTIASICAIVLFTRSTTPLQLRLYELEKSWCTPNLADVQLVKAWSRTVDRFPRVLCASFPTKGCIGLQGLRTKATVGGVPPFSLVC